MKPFELRVDLGRRRLDIVQRGFWDSATFDSFSTELSMALRKLQSRGGCVSALVDAREFAVQQREIAVRFKEMLRDLAPLCARRTATLVPAELNRLQAQHAGDAINSRTFSDPALAEAWLTEDASVAWLRSAARP
jgi:hypothetical protein